MKLLYTKYKIDPETLILWIGLSVLFFAFLGSSPVYILDESMFTEAAREMWTSKNYWIPYFNGALFVDKPPMQYYFMMLGFSIFGVNAFAARFFSAVIGLITVWVVYRFAKENFSPQVAKKTLTIFLCSFFFIQQFQLAVPDPYLIFFFTSALISFYNYYHNGNIKFLYGFYLLIGLGTLTKGPVAILLSGLIVILFLLFRGEIKNAFKYYPFLGLLGIMIIAAPWYWYVDLQTQGDFTKGFILIHNLSRFTSPMQGHGGGFYVTLGYVLLGLLPFSFFIPQAFINAFKNKKNPAILFLLIVSVVFIVFFALSATKLPNYTMPCYPFIVLLLANYLHKKEDEIVIGWNKISGYMLSFIGISLPFVAYFFLKQDSNLNDLKWLAAGLIPVSVFSTIGLYSVLIQKTKLFYTSTVIGWTSVAIFLFGLIYPTINNSNPVSAFKNKFGKELNLIVFERMDPAFPFNFKKKFKIIESIEVLKDTLLKNHNLYVLTNIRDSQALDTLSILEKKFEKKSPFEYHVTKLYKLKRSN